MVEKEPIYFKDGNLIWFTNYNKDKIIPEYLNIIFNTNLFQKMLVKRGMIGSVQNALTMENVKKIKIPVPSIEIQNNICDEVILFDEKLRLNNQLILLLEEYCQIIFHKWFVDYNFPDKDGKPYKDNGGEIYVVDKTKIPIGWKRTTIGNISKIFDSVRIPLSESERYGRMKIYPYYGATQIMDYIDEYIFDGVYCLIAEYGSVIDENNKPIMQWAWGRFWVNNHAHILQGSNNISTEYLYLTLKRMNVMGVVTGAIQKKINQSNLNNLPAILPTIDILNRFDNIIEPIFKKIMILNDENKLFEETRDLVIKKLIN